MGASMNLTDRAALDSIRKAAGNAVPEGVWEIVEKQAADQGGLLALTGTAQALVQAVVVKHGKHDQSSHGRKGGGGGGKKEPKGSGDSGGITPRKIIGAAQFLDNEGDVGSSAFAPTGLSNMSRDNAKRMIDHAKKLGWKDDGN